MPQFSLADLESIIESRAGADAAASYTKSLLEAGVPRMGKKLGEEAVETIIAALSGDRASLIGEAADLVFHLLVLLKSRSVAFDDVLAELAKRTAMSGHEEKARRKS
jgi:phosphoribosyl-ATP pyrophosphohydrolase